jgi:CheY-like chemotaxis protein
VPHAKVNNTIVVTDDEAPIRLVVSDRLRAAGYTVVEACNGEEGLDAARSHLPLAVISDLQMPHMNGLQLAMALKQDPETADIPVLLLTARGHILTPEQIAETNVKRVMSKPFGIRELSSYVREKLAPLPGAAPAGQAA